MTVIEHAEVHAEVAAAVLRAGRACWGHGGSSSMAPMVGPADRVLIDPASPTIRRGDLIAVEHDGAIVVHRVVVRRRRGCFTKGDASLRLDRFVPWSALLGRATVIELAEGGRLVLDAFPWVLIQRVFGLLAWWGWRAGRNPTLGRRLLCRALRLPFHGVACAARRRV